MANLDLMGMGEVLLNDATAKAKLARASFAHWYGWFRIWDDSICSDD